MANDAVESGDVFPTESFVLGIIEAIKSERNDQLHAGLASLNFDDVPPCLGLRQSFCYTVEAQPRFSVAAVEKETQVYLFSDSGRLCISDRMHFGVDNLQPVVLDDKVVDWRDKTKFKVRAVIDHKYQTRKRIFMTMDHLKKLGYAGLEAAVETFMTRFYENQTEGEWPSRRRQSLAKRSGKYLSPLCLSCPFAGWKCAPAKTDRWARVADVVAKNAQARKDEDEIDQAISAIGL